MSIKTVKCFIVNLNFQGFLYFLFGAVFGKAFQTFLPFIKLVFVATAEENLLYNKVAAVIIIIYHPVGIV